MNDTPDLSGYRAIHHALRAGTHAMAAAAAELDPRDDQRLSAFDRYWKGYAGEVVAHHTVEDDVVFPGLIARVPVAEELIRTTDDEHHQLDRLMEVTASELAGVRCDRRTSALAGALAELADLMDRHLTFEDVDILPLIERHVTDAEYQAMEKAARKQLGVGRQAAFTVPFVSYWMAPDEFGRLLAKAPLPFRLLHRAMAQGHARLAATVFGSAAARREGVA
jgi:hemerythrin-like domain-containing protein